MFDFHYQTPDDAFIHFNAAIYLDRVCIEQPTDRPTVLCKCIENIWPNPFISHSYLFGIADIFNHSAIIYFCHLSTDAFKRLHTTLVHSLIFDAMCIVIWQSMKMVLFHICWKSTPQFCSWPTNDTRVLQTFVWHRQFITDKILLLQQMLSANFWWVFRLQCLRPCRITLGWVYFGFGRT